MSISQCIERPPKEIGRFIVSSRGLGHEYLGDDAWIEASALSDGDVLHWYQTKQWVTRRDREMLFGAFASALRFHGMTEGRASWLPRGTDDAAQMARWRRESRAFGFMGIGRAAR